MLQGTETRRDGAVGQLLHTMEAEERSKPTSQPSNAIVAYGSAQQLAMTASSGANGVNGACECMACWLVDFIFGLLFYLFFGGGVVVALV